MLRLRLLLPALLSLVVFSAKADYNAAPANLSGSGAPTGSCTSTGQEYIDNLTNNMWICNSNSTWKQSTRSLGQTMQVGQAVGTNFQASTKTYTGPVTSGSNAFNYTGLYYIYPGLYVTDSLGYLPAGTTVATVASNVNSLTLSNNATGTSATDALTFYYNWAMEYIPHYNATGQTITDLRICYAGGNQGYNATNAEFAINNQLVQSAIEYPQGGVPANVIFPGEGLTETLVPGDVACGNAAGLEIPAGATWYERVLVQTGTLPSTQNISFNRVSQSQYAQVMLGGSVLPTVTGPTPAKTANLAAGAAASQGALVFGSTIPNIPGGTYVSSTTANLANIAAGTKVSAQPTGTTVNLTANLLGALANNSAMTFTSYQAFAYPSVATTSGSTTLIFSACPPGVGQGFFVTSASGMPYLDQVVSCTAGTMTLATAMTASIPTTQPIQFSSFNGGTYNLFNAVSVQANVQNRGLSFLVDGDSEVGVASGFTVSTTTTAAFNPTSCVSNQATLSVGTTYGTQVQLSGNSVLGVGFMAYQYGSGNAISPWTNYPLTNATQIVSFVPNTSITISPCPLYTIPSGQTIVWGGSGYDPYNSTGYIEAGLNLAPVTGLERSGDGYTLWQNNRSMKTQIWGQKGFTHAISSMCDNDIAGTSGVTAFPALQSLYQNMWNAYAARGLKVIKTTCVPRSLSSVGEPLWVIPTITAGGSGYTPSTSFTATVAGGTLSSSIPGTATPTTLTCTANSSGVIPTGGCTVATIGNYSTAPTLANNAVTGGAGSGLTVTLSNYQGWLDLPSQYSYGVAFQPTVTTTTTAAVNASTTVPVASVTSGAGTIAANMYLSINSGAPTNALVTSVSGNNVTLSTPVTLASGASVSFVSLRTEFNDWVRTLPSPLTGVIDQSTLDDSSFDSGLWAPTYSLDGLHGSPVAILQVADMIQAGFTNGLFTLP